MAQPNYLTAENQGQNGDHHRRPQDAAGQGYDEGLLCPAGGLPEGNH